MRLLKEKQLFFSSLLVVGDCQRCLAICTNTNNCGQWAPDGRNINSGKKSISGTDTLTHFYRPAYLPVGEKFFWLVQFFLLRKLLDVLNAIGLLSDIFVPHPKLCFLPTLARRFVNLMACRFC